MTMGGNRDSREGSYSSTVAVVAILAEGSMVEGRLGLDDMRGREREMDCGTR